MSIMAPGAPGTTTHPNPSPVVETLVALNAAPNLFDAMERDLTDPSTPAGVRRFIAHILALGERLAVQGVAA
jgi:hypothetical protein